MVWMYKCSGDFSSCDGSGANWFKIDEGGFTPASGVYLDTEVGSGWQIAKLVGGNKSWSSKVPAGLAPGNYLVRHELIALHQARSPQWYAECAQIVITGSGSASPDGSYKTSIPGYAGDNDSNIRVSINAPFPENGFLLITPSSSTSTTTAFLRPTRCPDLLSTRAPPRGPRLSLLKY
jgi:hypothetical protein